MEKHFNFFLLGCPFVCIYVDRYAYMYIHSFLQGWNPPLFWGNPPLSGYPLFLKQIKKIPPIFLNHPNCCMQIVWITLKLRSYILYYTESIENSIFSLLFIPSGLTLYLLLTFWFDIAFHVFHIWCARGMNMKHF